MVFGFGKKKSNKDAQSAPTIRGTPSLPDLSQARQAIVWPTTLVDQEEMRQARAKTAATVPYHKPFHPYASLGADEEGRARPMRYSEANDPPSAFTPNRMSTVSGTTNATGTRKISTRRPKVAPSFNIMVAGCKQTGKTSFLRLLLETADISPTATMEQRAELESFLAHKPKRTTAFNSVRIEIMDSPTDRLLLTVIDTPGLDFNHGRELVLEQQTNALVHELDSRFAETLIEESKVVRTSKGDQHIHLCIYFIDPVASIIDRKEEARHADIQQHTPPETSPLADAVDSSDSEYSDSESEPDSPSPGQRKSSRNRWEHIHLRASEIRTLRRLAPKVNLLPVIARMDSMTDARLRDVKRAVKRELEQAGIGFGVFALGPSSPGDQTPKKETRRPTTAPNSEAHNGEGYPQSPVPDEAPLSPISPTDSNDVEDDDPSSTPRRAVIKIRPTRFPTELTRKRSQSRIRRAHMQSNESDEEFEIARAKASIKEAAKLQEQHAANDPRRKRMSLASMRFFDHTRALLSRDAMEGGGEHLAAHREADRLLPFALVNPERRYKRERPTSFNVSVEETDPDVSQERDVETSLFIRKFRWGTIDVLNASHCDFVPMRTAIFGSHLKALRKRTKDAYEQYRTEKLLIRKARKMRQSLHPQDPSANSGDGSAGEGGSWVDVTGSKVDVTQGKVRSGSIRGHATLVKPRPRREVVGEAI